MKNGGGGRALVSLGQSPPSLHLLCYYRLKFASLPPAARDLCLQTAHVAVDAFPNRSLSLSSAATRKAGSFPSAPRLYSSAATALASSRPTNSPPSRSS